MQVNKGSNIISPTYTQNEIHSGDAPEGVYQYIKYEHMFLICIKDYEGYTTTLLFSSVNNCLEPLVDSDGYEWNPNDDVFQLTDLSVNLELV